MHPTWFKDTDSICHDMENCSSLEERSRSDCGARYTGRYRDIPFGALHCNLALNQQSRTIYIAMMKNTNTGQTRGWVDIRAQYQRIIFSMIRIHGFLVGDTTRFERLSDS